MVNGVFIFSINSSIWENSGKKLPIINNNNSFILDITANSNNSTTTVSINYSYEEINGIDGLKFFEIVSYYDNSSIVIQQFGSIPLSNSSFQLKGGGWYKDGYTKKPKVEKE